VPFNDPPRDPAIRTFYADRDPEPSVGRVVHYVSHGTPVRVDGSQAYESECRAAIITEVSEETGFGKLVGLCVLNPTGTFFNRGVEHDRTGETGGTWHWPERTP
jgi:hypothetical protein